MTLQTPGPSICDCARIGATFVIGLVVLLLASCASFTAAPLAAGMPEADVIARLGRPTHVFVNPHDSGRILEYMNGPFGQTTYFARLDPDGRLSGYEQVLTTQKFAQIQIGAMTKFDVVRLIGTPSETSYLALPKLEVWSYPYKENPVSDSMMHVHFDDAGVVRKLLNGPDMRRDPERQGRFGMGFRGRD